MQIFKALFLALIFSTLAACGGGGGGGDTPEPSPKNKPPTVSLSADSLSVSEGTTVTLKSTVSDSDGTIQAVLWEQLSGPDVTLSDNSARETTFTAPETTETVELEFQLTATDNKKAKTKDSITITVTTNNQAPTANAGADKDGFVGTTVELDGSASSDDGSVAAYKWTQTNGTPVVSLNNETTSTASFTVPVVTSSTPLVFELETTDNRGTKATDTVTITLKPNVIGGQVKYDNVPHDTTGGGLDYDNTTQDPVRGAVVQLVGGDTTLAETTTDASGNYSFINPDLGETVKVRVRAEYKQDDAGASQPSWDISVIDNTNSDALYTMVSSDFTSSAGETTKNLTAASGWTGSDYTEPRSAAPFHILDRAYDMVQKILGADSDVDMPAVSLNWSIDNKAVSGDKTIGEITTSHYTDGKVFILGFKDSDTDEYDGHIILHELGHYFEDKLSRSDSIGGPHGGSDLLDMRVAFGEGFGNAWSGMISDDPVYRDTLGPGQASGFSIDVESDTTSNPGWYSETSVQRILYDLYDSDNESGAAGDDISLGFNAIYDQLVGDQKTTPAFTSIFSFIHDLKNNHSAQSADINTLVNANSILSDTIDIYGSTETNDDSGAANVLPVYTQLTLGAPDVQLCSIGDYGNYNKLSNIRFVRFRITAPGSYKITATPTGANAAAVNLGFAIFKDGDNFLGRTAEMGAGSPVAVKLTASPGDFIAEFYDYANLNSDPADNHDGCFNITLKLSE